MYEIGGLFSELSNCLTSAGRFENVKLIGEGCFGKVFRGTDRIDKAEYAIKQIDPSLLADDEIWNEIRLLAQLKHPNILRYHYSWPEDHNCSLSIPFHLPTEVRPTKYLYIQAEYCSNGTISKIINQGLHTDRGHRLRYAIEVADGMCYLHSKNVMHGDLHAGNIFLDSEDHIQIGDFGLATMRKNSNTAGLPRNSEDFEEWKRIDNKALKNILIQLLIPFPQDSGTYGRERRNFIDKDIESPEFDPNEKAYILRLRGLKNSGYLTAQEMKNILTKPMNPRIDVESPIETKPCTKPESNWKENNLKISSTPMGIQHPVKTEPEKTKDNSLRTTGFSLAVVGSCLAIAGSCLAIVSCLLAKNIMSVFFWILILIFIMIIWTIMAISPFLNDKSVGRLHRMPEPLLR